jgi:hypothetical protein
VPGADGTVCLHIMSMVFVSEKIWGAVQKNAAILLLLVFNENHGIFDTNTKYLLFTNSMLIYLYLLMAM